MVEDGDESILNNNVKISALDISLSPMDESNVIEGNGNTHTSAKLSITLDQTEKDLLTKQKGRNVRSDSQLMKISDGGSCTTTPAEKDITNNTNNTNTNDISIQEEQPSAEISKTIVQDGNNNDSDEDESVIPVEDEDDEITEESTLQSSKQEDTQYENAGNDMFKHLQPSKTEEKETTIEMEVTEEEDILQEDSYLEDPSQLLPDENGFFKYPIVELGRRLWPSSDQKQCYTKGAIWSPDGTCLLVPVHMDGKEMFTQ